MTEKSFFHEGATGGDAVYAPYSSKTFAELQHLLYGLDGVFEQVVGYNLAVSPSANLTVSIARGSAMVGGILYISSAAETLTHHANTSGQPRMDRVVIRVNWTAKTGTLVIKNGIPGPVPEPPALVQVIGEVYEISLARIYIPDSLAVITAGHIVDEREYLDAYNNAVNTYFFPNHNLMPNSEFMASADTGELPAAPPAYWQAISGVCSAAARFDRMARGTTTRVVCPTLGDGIRSYPIPLARSATSVPATARLLIEVEQGEIWIDTDNGSSTGVIIPMTNGPVEVILRRYYNSTNQTLTFKIVNNSSSGTAIFKLGQITVALGNVGAPFVPQREIIFFQSPLVQTGYNLKAVSTFTYEIPVDSRIPPGISSALVRLDVRDSASAGTDTVYATFQDALLDENNHLRIELGREVNDVLRAAQGFVGVPYTGGDFIYMPDIAGADSQILHLAVLATGTETMDVTLTYIGIVT